MTLMQGICNSVSGILVLFYLVSSFMAGFLLQLQPNALSSKTVKESLCHSRLSLLTCQPISCPSTILQAAGVHTSKTLPDLCALLSAGLSASDECSFFSLHPFLPEIPLLPIT